MSETGSAQSPPLKRTHSELKMQNLESDDDKASSSRALSESPLLSDESNM